MLKRFLAAFCAGFLIALPLQAGDVGSSGVSYPSGGGSSATTSTGWTRTGTNVLLTNTSDSVGLGGTTDGSYKLDIISSAGLRIRSTSSSSTMYVAGTTAVNLILDADTNGISTSPSVLKFLQNASQVSHLGWDPSTQLITMNYSNSDVSATGLSINTSNNFGLGAAPTGTGTSAARLEVSGPIKISTTTQGYTLYGSTATGSGTVLLGTNAPTAFTTPTPYAWIDVQVGTVTCTFPVWPK